MTALPDLTEVTARDLLAAQFPGWSIWRSDAGRWWATRRTPPTAAQGDAGCDHTVDADTPADLCGVLAEQERRARGAA